MRRTYSRSEKDAGPLLQKLLFVAQFWVSTVVFKLSILLNHPVWLYLKVIKDAPIYIAGEVSPSGSTSEHALEIFTCSSYAEGGQRQLVGSCMQSHSHFGG